MPPIRHIDARSPEAPAPEARESAAPVSEATRQAALDAARATLLELGWRRTTLTGVARRAGLSRMTIYRAWPDMAALLGDLMTREWIRLMEGADGADGADGAAPLTPVEIAADIVARIDTLRGDELFARILEVDPEIVLPYLFVRRGRSQELVVQVLAANIAAGQAAGVVRPDDPVALARSVVLVAHGFTLSAHTMTDDRVDAAALRAGLTRAVVGVLAPDAGDDTGGAAR